MLATLSLFACSPSTPAGTAEPEAARPTLAALVAAPDAAVDEVPVALPIERRLPVAAIGEALPANILLVVLDDVGVDKLAAYGEHPDQPFTPSLDALAAGGQVFRNAYASPTCSPTRAEILTGRESRRYGLGRAIDIHTDPYSVPVTEVTLPRMLEAAPLPYSAAMIGKWHLASALGPDPLGHPAALGFADAVVSFGNLGEAFDAGARRANYFDWEKIVDGVPTRSRTYAPTDLVDEAVLRLETLPEPFFLEVTLNSAHTPFHVPPAELQGTGVARGADRADLYAAMLEAADTEIGRLLAAMDPDLRDRTTVFVVGDNGTEAEVIEAPFRPTRQKGTLFDGGVRVPLLVSGPGITPGAESDALVSVVDLFPTLAELAGVDPATFPNEIDGVSFLPQLRDPAAPGREFVYSDEFYPNGDGPRQYDNQMIRNATHKLVMDGGVAQLYRYSGGIDEGRDLLAGRRPLSDDDAAALAVLEAALADELARLGG